MVGGYENNVEVKDITEPNNCNLYLPNGCNWRDEYIILGTDVTALFPSLSAGNTAKCVRNQIEKSTIEWKNIDTKWLTLYIKLNENNVDTEDMEAIKQFLPHRISKMGRAIIWKLQS